MTEYVARPEPPERGDRWVIYQADQCVVARLHRPVVDLIVPVTGTANQVSRVMLREAPDLSARLHGINDQWMFAPHFQGVGRQNPV